MTIDYRLATMDDYQDVLDMTLSFLAESPKHAKVEVDNAWVESRLLRAMGDADSNVFLVATLMNKPIGMFWVSLGQDLVDAGVLAVDQFGFTKPLYRDRGVASDMLLVMQEYLFEVVKVKELRLITFASPDNVRMDRWIGKRGYERIGSVFIKENV